MRPSPLRRIASLGPRHLVARGLAAIVLALVTALPPVAPGIGGWADETPPWMDWGGIAALGLLAPAVAPEPAYLPDPLPEGLDREFVRQSFKRDAGSGNYLGPRVSSKTLNERLVPVAIAEKWTTDLRGRTVFVRQSIRAKLLEADAAMFKAKQKHLVINYGFRSNAVQQELYAKLHGKGKVAAPGLSFHETGMAVDLSNWHDAQRFMIEAGFVGGCYGIEEDMVHYSVAEITKASNATAFKRCTFKEIPEQFVKGLKKTGAGIKKTGGIVSGRLKRN